jgi:phosphatidylinositol alpha-1,6-mannosyltransferase
MNNMNEKNNEGRRFLVTDRYLPHMGGSRVYYHQIAKRLGLEVLTGPEPGDQKFDSEQNYPIVRLRGIRPVDKGHFKPKSTLLKLMLNYWPPISSAIFWTLWLAWRRSPELIHAGGWLVGGCAAWCLKKLNGTPYILYAHGEELQGALVSRYLKKAASKVFRDADAVVVNSRFTLNLALRIGTCRECITIVHPGVDQGLLDAPLKKKDELKDLKKQFGVEGRRVLLTVGRLTLRKGHDKVLDALASWEDRPTDLVWFIVGRGEEEKRLKMKVIELGLEKTVKFVTDADQVCLANWYDAADLFVLANRDLGNDVEGFGMVFIEAGARGLTVIGGASGGATEAILHRQTGLLVNPENPDDLLQALQLLTTDKNLLRRLGAENRRWAKGFGWDSRAKSINTVSHNVLAAIERDSATS